jgi:hypothetical protein
MKSESRNLPATVFDQLPRVSQAEPLVAGDLGLGDSSLTVNNNGSSDDEPKDLPANTLSNPSPPDISKLRKTGHSYFA